MSDLLNSASLVMIPSGYKEDTVFSAIPTDGSGDLSFTRASNGTRINSAGLVEVCPWNLAGYSEDFGNVYWDKGNITITSDAIVSPNGTTTADKICDANNSNTVHLVSRNMATTGVAYTASVYMKKGDYNYGQVHAYDYTGAIFDLVNGTVISSDALGATITSIGDGWFRCTYSFVALNQGVFFNSSKTSTSAYYYTGTTGYGIYAWGYQLNIGSTAKPYFPTTDRLNVPRLTYQNGGGGCPSLLLEKQSTNVITYSEDFSNAAWVLDGDGAGQSVTANYATSPDGTQNAERLQLNRTGGTYSRLRQVYTAGFSGSATMSVYLKTNDNTTKNLILRLGSAGSTIITVTPNWQRFTNTQSIIYSLNFDFEVFIESSQVSTVSADLSIWGAQLEASSYPTSYIPTTSASATRVADVAVKSSISSLFGVSATSLFMDFEITQVSGGGNWTVTGWDGTNLFSLCQFDSASNFPRIVFDGGVDTTLGTALSIGRHKIAVSFATNDFRAYIDGALVLTDTSCTYNRYDRIAVNGTAWTGNNNNNNSFKLNQYAQFPNVLTNAELASLTTL